MEALAEAAVLARLDVATARGQHLLRLPLGRCVMGREALKTASRAVSREHFALTASPGGLQLTAVHCSGVAVLRPSAVAAQAGVASAGPQLIILRAGESCEVRECEAAPLARFRLPALAPTSPSSSCPLQLRVGDRIFPERRDTRLLSGLEVLALPPPSSSPPRAPPAHKAPDPGPRQQATSPTAIAAAVLGLPQQVYPSAPHQAALAGPVAHGAPQAGAQPAPAPHSHAPAVGAALIGLGRLDAVPQGRTGEAAATAAGGAAAAAGVGPGAAEVADSPGRLAKRQRLGPAAAQTLPQAREAVLPLAEAQLVAPAPAVLGRPAPPASPLPTLPVVPAVKPDPQVEQALQAAVQQAVLACAALAAVPVPPPLPPPQPAEGLWPMGAEPPPLQPHLAAQGAAQSPTDGSAQPPPLSSADLHEGVAAGTALPRGSTPLRAAALTSVAAELSSGVAGGPLTAPPLAAGPDLQPSAPGAALPLLTPALLSDPGGSAAAPSNAAPPAEPGAATARPGSGSVAAGSTEAAFESPVGSPRFAARTVEGLLGRLGAGTPPSTQQEPLGLMRFLLGGARGSGGGAGAPGAGTGGGAVAGSTAELEGEPAGDDEERLGGSAGEGAGVGIPAGQGTGSQPVASVSGAEGSLELGFGGSSGRGEEARVAAAAAADQGPGGSGEPPAGAAPAEQAGQATPAEPSPSGLPSPQASLQRQAKPLVPAGTGEGGAEAGLLAGSKRGAAAASVPEAAPAVGPTSVDEAVASPGEGGAAAVVGAEAETQLADPAELRVWQERLEQAQARALAQRAEGGAGEPLGGPEAEPQAPPRLELPSPHRGEQPSAASRGPSRPAQAAEDAGGAVQQQAEGADAGTATQGRAADGDVGTAVASPGARAGGGGGGGRGGASPAGGGAFLRGVRLTFWTAFQDELARVGLDTLRADSSHEDGAWSAAPRATSGCASGTRDPRVTQV
jgi:hypothetical protein